MNKVLILPVFVVLVFVLSFSIHDAKTSVYGATQGGMGNMMSGMTSDVPQDVVVKLLSNQKVPVGKESQIELLVLDKNTKKPLTNAQVIGGIEKGAPTSTMDMAAGTLKAKNIGNGKYVVKFTLSSAGYYTLHIHVILAGKSMNTMMNNHMNIGIIAK